MKSTRTYGCGFLCGIVVLCMAACSGTNNPPFLIKDGVLTVHATEQEIAESRRVLLSVRDGQVPKEMQGAAVFDCVVANPPTTEYRGQPIFEATVEHVYAGADQLHGGIVGLISPSEKNGGVTFATNRRYRVSAVNLDSAAPGLYVWSATVVELH